MLRKVAVTFTSVVLLAAANAKALGLGEVTLDSALNQPLNARIELLQLEGVALDQIQVQMASADDFERLAIDRLAFLDHIQLSIGSSGPDSYIQLSSAQAVGQPSLRFVLETRWPAGRLLSEYSVNLDQSVFAESLGGERADGGGAAAIQQPVGSGFSSQNTVNNQQTAAQIASGLSGSSVPVSGTASEPPQRLAAADQPESVTVSASDTLWDIALSVRPDSSVSVQQTMLALQRLNREAFIADNINMVRNGQVLRVPDLAEIRALDAREAINEVSRQNQLFDNRRNVPLTSQPLTAQPDPTSNAALNRGELRVVTSDDNAADTNATQSANGIRTAEFDARINSLENDLAVQEEEVDRVTLQNNELNERLAMLEQQIASAREIIRLRDLELAQLQQALVAAAEPDTQTSSPQAGTAAPGSNAAEPADSPTVVSMAPERSLPQRLMDSIAANTYMLLGVAALVVLLLVFALLRRNRSAEEEEPLVGSVDDDGINSIHEAADVSAVEAVALAVEGDQPDDAETDSAEAETFVADDDAEAARLDSNDPVEQADALISRADYAAAIAVLRNAIVAEPQRSDLRLKLLEVYVANQDAIGFKLQETELRDLGDASVAPRIAELRAHLRSEVDDEILEEGEDVFLQEENELDPLADLEANLDLEASAAVDDERVRSGYRIDEEADAEAEEMGEVAVEASPEFDLAAPADEYDDLQFLNMEVSDEDLAAELEEEEEFSFLSSVDEAATKLDLARAYIEMGDQDGAREILEEVVVEGSAAQIEDARTLLSKL